MAKANAFNLAVEKRVREFYAEWIDKVENHEREIRINTYFTRQQTLDFVTITLGVMGINSKWLVKFKQTFEEVEKELGQMVVEDGYTTTDGRGRDIHTLTYSKTKIDEELKKYVDEENFTPWAERYAKCYEEAVNGQS